jgi:chemotaxis protein methyltransferase CheR
MSIDTLGKRSSLRGRSSARGNPGAGGTAPGSRRFARDDDFLSRPADAELAMDGLRDSDFQRLAEFIEDYCGIRTPEGKRTLVEGRLRRRVRALGLSSLDEYCYALFDQGRLAEETVPLIDAITTNKTEFFREGEHFQLLIDRLLPEWLARRSRGEQQLKLWSAGCSTGAEAYTLAMLLDAFNRAQRGFRFSILATDISSDVLARAKAAVYPEEMVEPVPEELRRRYFLRARDPSARTVRLCPAIRQMVAFGRLNLMSPVYPVNEMDIIFCRNTLIYFERETQQKVLAKLSSHLQPGGYLFVGHTETVSGMDLPLKQVATSVFMRR